MNRRFYTGIGSRTTPPDILLRMTNLAKGLAGLDYWLRSGGAGGADSAFEAGAGDLKEIYLPWQTFNGNPSPLYTPSAEALLTVDVFHPMPHRLSRPSRLMMARNAHQVLGQNMRTPSEFVICWTPEGAGGGGTGQAIRIAKATGIPVYDLGNPEHLKYVDTTILPMVWQPAL